MSIPIRADLNVGIINQYTLNNRGGIEGVGQSVIGFYDPTFGLPIATNGDRYISLATANGWIQNYISVYNDGIWKTFPPLDGAIIWIESTNVINIWNPVTTGWEDGITFFGAIGAPVPPVIDNAVVRFNGISGNSIQQSPMIMDDLGNTTGINNLATTGNVSVGGTFTRGTTTIDASSNLNVGGTLTRSPTTIDTSGNITGVPSLTTTGNVSVGGTFTRGTTTINASSNLNVGGTLTRSPTTIDISGNITGVPSLTTTGNVSVGGSFTRGATSIDTTGNVFTSPFVLTNSLSATNSASISSIQFVNNSIFNLSSIETTSLKVTTGNAIFDNKIISRDPYMVINDNSSTQGSGIVMTSSLIGQSTGILSSPGFVAGVPGVSNPTVSTIVAIFSPGDIVEVSGSNENDGIYEVLSHIGNTLTIKGIGTVPTVEEFTDKSFITAPGAGFVSAKRVSVIRTNSNGDIELFTGTSTGSPFIPIPRINEVVSTVKIFSPFDTVILVPVPSGATHMWATVWGGGGTGGFCDTNGGGGGGGAGGASIRVPVSITGLTNISCVVGSGGGFGPGSFLYGSASIVVAGSTFISGGGGGAGGNGLGNRAGGGGGGGSDFLLGTSGQDATVGAHGVGGIAIPDYGFYPSFSIGSAAGGDGADPGAAILGGRVVLSTFAAGGAGGGGGGSSLTSTGGGNGGNNVGGLGGSGGSFGGGLHGGGGGGAAGFYGAGAAGLPSSLPITDNSIPSPGVNSGAGGGGGGIVLGVPTLNRNGGGGGIILEFA